MTRMIFNRWFHVTVLFALYQTLVAVASQQCGSESSIYGMMLRRHTFHKMKTNDAFECLQACNADVRCQSFNYVMSKDKCEMNNRTKDARPMDFVPNEERYYMTRDREKVLLGSIPELPAESCKEIKASEKEVAVSGKYWLDSIAPGKTVLVFCDMTTEDVDECSASFTICDANATCQNAVGSFSCTCKNGFSGDGKRCTDIDECEGNTHDCDDNATCQNTLGSHTCKCKVGFAGDGRLCTAIGDECVHYQSLTAADRKTTYTSQSAVQCDNLIIPGWYRFQGAAGTRMATSCQPIQRCSTHASGWLNGTHPTDAEGKVTRQVCFHWSSNCCNWSVNIDVRNCGAYYVYYFSKTPACQLRYCGTD